MTQKAKAFAPAGISSFFEICETTPRGRPISDPVRIGARGGGFVIDRGTTTEVTISPSMRNHVDVFINGKRSQEAQTTRTVALSLLKRTEMTYKVAINHSIEVPVGAGFGSSAAGALSTALALSDAMKLNCTYNELGRIAHVAEIKCRTGLGTVGPLMVGGCVLTLEPGAPGQAVIDRLLVSRDSVVVAGIFRGISTRDVLMSRDRRIVINRQGRRTLEKILADPSLENFLTSCQEFAEKTGFMNEKLRELVRLAEKAGALGAAQNMVGEVVHAVTSSENADNVVQAFKQALPLGRILSAKIDFQGARLSG